MTIRQALLKATQQLNQVKINSASLDADVLLTFILNKSKEYLYTYPEKELTKKQTEKYNQLIKKRRQRIPVAYLTNHKEFYGLDFYVNRDVLIPRPLTEQLVEKVINEIENEQKKNKKRITIADIGTGSGCIPVAIKKHLPQATVYATDISKKALAVAKKNAKKYKTTIKFFRGDLLKPLKNKKIDFLIANLPYLKSDQIKNELTYEPKQAVVGSVNDIKRLLKEISELKQKPEKIFLEIDKRQEKVIKQTIKKYQLKAFLVSAYAASEYGKPKK